MALDATDETVIYFFFPLIQSQGSNVFADDGVTAEGYLNGDAALNTVTWIKEMVDKGYASATPEANSFELGKAAMAVNGSWAPAVILLFVFLFVPFIMTLGYSFTNYNILKPDAMKFVGLKNLLSWRRIRYSERVLSIHLYLYFWLCRSRWGLDLVWRF